MATVIVAAVAIVLAVRSGQSSGGSGPFVGGDLHSLVADPALPHRLYVGGHQGVGVSDDDGKTWRPVRSLDGADAMGWAFAGTTVFQGGHPGLHLSADGTTFSGHNDGLPATDVHALGGTAGAIYAASPMAGFLASTDNGTTWETRNPNFGRSFMGRILVDPANSQRLVATDMEGGVVQSSDGGRAWKRLGRAQAGMWATWVGGNGSKLIVSGPDGAARTDNNGDSWTPVALPEGASLVEASPTDPNVLFAAGLSGSNARIWVSRNGGTTWRPT